MTMLNTQPASTRPWSLASSVPPGSAPEQTQGWSLANSRPPSDATPPAADPGYWTQFTEAAQSGQLDSMKVATIGHLFASPDTKIGGADAYDNLAALNLASQQYKPTRGEQQMATAQGFGETAMAYLTNPAAVGRQAVKSLVPVVEIGGVPAAMGGIAGGAIGSVVPGAGTAAGAAIGTAIGTGGGSAVISGTLKVLDLMEAQGIDTTNPAAIKAARNDPAVWGPIAQQASLYGIGVGLFDAASAGAASKLSQMARGATVGVARGGGIGSGIARSPFVRGGVESLADKTVQGLMGAGGEVAGGELAGTPYNWNDVLGEFTGEFAGAPLEHAMPRQAAHAAQGLMNAMGMNAPPATTPPTPGGTTQSANPTGQVQQPGAAVNDSQQQPQQTYPAAEPSQMGASAENGSAFQEQQRNPEASSPTVDPEEQQIIDTLNEVADLGRQDGQAGTEPQVWEGMPSAVQRAYDRAYREGKKNPTPSSSDVPNESTPAQTSAVLDPTNQGVASPPTEPARAEESGTTQAGDPSPIVPNPTPGGQMPGNTTQEPSNGQETQGRQEGLLSPAVTAAPAGAEQAPAATRQPWEMTLREWQESKNLVSGDELKRIMFDDSKSSTLGAIITDPTWRARLQIDKYPSIANTPVRWQPFSKVNGGGGYLRRKLRPGEELGALRNRQRNAGTPPGIVVVSERTAPENILHEAAHAARDVLGRDFDYKSDYKDQAHEKSARRVNAEVTREHRRAVEQAIRDGKPVSAAVLADYPDLAPTSPSTPAPTPRPQPAAQTAAAPAGPAVEGEKGNASETVDGKQAANKPQISRNPADKPQASRSAQIEALRARGDNGTLIDRLTAKEAELTKRLGQGVPRSGKPGQRSGATTLFGDALTLAHLAAVKVIKAGVRTYQAAADAWKSVHAENGSPKLSEAEHKEAIREVRRIARDAGNDGANLETAIASSQARHSPEPRETTKQTVTRETGVNAPKSTVEVDQRKALSKSLQQQEKATAAAFKEGQATPKVTVESIKARIARITGMNTRMDVEAAFARQANKAIQARNAIRATRRGERAQLVDRMEIQLQQLAETVERTGLAVEQRAVEKAAPGIYRTAQADKKAVAKKAAAVVRKFAPPELAKKFLNSIASARKDSDVENLMAKVLQDLSVYRKKRAEVEAKLAFKKADPKRLNLDLRKEQASATKQYKSVQFKHDAAMGVLQTQLAAAKGATRAEVQGRIAELNNETRRQLVEITQKVQAIKQAQKHFREVQVAGRQMKKAEVVNDFLTRTEALPDLVNRDKIQSDADAPWYARLWRSGYNRDTLAAMLGDGHLGQLLVNDTHAGESKFLGDVNEGNEDVRKALESVGIAYGSEEARKMSATAEGQRAELKTVNLPSGKTLRITPGELGTIYAIITRNKARKNIIGGAPILLRRLQTTKGFEQGVRLTRDDVNHIERTIDPKLKAIIDSLKKAYEKRVTPGMQAAHLEHFGYALDTDPGYWQTKRQADRQEPEGLILDWNKTGAASLAGNSMFKPLQEGAIRAPYYIDDAFQTYRGMVRDAAAITHLNQTSRSLSSLMRTPAVKNRLIQKFGKSAYMDVAQKIEEGSIIIRRDTNVPGAAMKVTNTLKRNLSRAWLAISPSAVLKNIGGTFKVLPYFSPKHYAEGVKALTSGATYKRMIEGSAFFRAHHEGSAALQASMILGETSDILGPASKKDLAKRIWSGDILDKPAAMGQMVDALEFFGWGDARASLAAWRMAELTINEQQPALTGKARTDAVAALAEKAVRGSQNPKSRIDQSTAQAKYANTPFSMLFQFTSDGIASMNLLRSTAIRHGVRSKEFGKVAGAVALNNAWAAGVTTALIQAVPFIAGKLGGNGDDEEFRKGRRSFAAEFARNFAANSAGMVYGASQLYEVGESLWDAVTGQQGRKFDAAITPVGRTVSDSIQSVLTLAKAGHGWVNAETAKDKEEAAAKLWKDTTRLVGTASPLIGNPLMPVYRLGERAVRGATEEADRPTAIKAAAEAIQSNNPDRAAFVVGVLIQNIPPKANRGDEIAKIRDAMIRQGPSGKLTEKEFAEVRNGKIAADAAAMVRDRAKWRQQVMKAIQAANAKK